MKNRAAGRATAIQFTQGQLVRVRKEYADTESGCVASVLGPSVRVNGVSWTPVVFAETPNIYSAYPEGDPTFFKARALEPVDKKLCARCKGTGKCPGCCNPQPHSCQTCGGSGEVASVIYESLVPAARLSFSRRWAMH